MENEEAEHSISPAKLEANRRNAQLSTGPKTSVGKDWSKQNALRHGILANVFLVSKGAGKEDSAAFEDLLQGLSQDLQPEGRLEHALVEKLAVCLWRKRRVLSCEAREIEALSTIGSPPWNDRLIPEADALDRILRYEASADRQFGQALTQLERLQRTRKGENIPAPLALNVTTGG